MARVQHFCFFIAVGQGRSAFKSLQWHFQRLLAGSITLLSRSQNYLHVLVSYRKHLSQKQFDKLITKFVPRTFCTIIVLTVSTCLLLIIQLLTTNHLPYLRFWRFPLAISFLLTIGISIAVTTVSQVRGDGSVSFQF